MLRITLTSQNETETVLKVEGWLSGGDVDLLAAEGTRRLQESNQLVLELSGLRSIDRGGVAQLKQWVGERLALRGAQPFVKALLEDHGLVVQTETK